MSYFFPREPPHPEHQPSRTDHVVVVLALVVAVGVLVSLGVGLGA